MQQEPLRSEDPFEVGFRIGQQQRMEASAQQAAFLSEMRMQSERPAVQNSITIRNTKEGFPIVRGFLSLLAVGTLAFVAIDGATSSESDNSGTSSTIIDARSRHSIVVWTGQKIVSGSADHDVLGPSANPWSYSVGIVERQVEYIPQGALEVQAVDDPDLGFYLLMTETKDGASIPMDFSSIEVTTPKPEPCPIEIVDNEIRPKDYCTPIDAVDTRGLMSTSAWQGGPFQNDTHISTDGRRALNVAIDNTYCELGLVFGTPDVSKAIAGDSSGMTQENVYNGIELAVKTAIRIDLSNQYGLPLTNEIGRPYILWADDVAMLKEIVREKNMPLSEFTADDYRGAVRLKMALGDDSGGGAIDPGPNYATEILDLRDKYEDVNVPSQTPGITRENAATSGWNFNCLPGVGTPEAEELVRQQWVRERVGMLAESPVYARPEGDGSYYSSEEAAAMVAAFRERTGV